MRATLYRRRNGKGVGQSAHLHEIGLLATLCDVRQEEAARPCCTLPVSPKNQWDLMLLLSYARRTRKGCFIHVTCRRCEDFFLPASAALR